MNFKEEAIRLKINVPNQSIIEQRKKQELNPNKGHHLNSSFEQHV